MIGQRKTPQIALRGFFLAYSHSSLNRRTSLAAWREEGGTRRRDGHRFRLEGELAGRVGPNNLHHLVPTFATALPC